MKLYSKLAHICLDDVRRDPVRKELVRTYFAAKQGRFGYHASQLGSLHKIPKPLAAKMSSVFNLWLDDLEALSSDLPEKLVSRLQACTKSFTPLSGRPSRCLTKVCPWCRGITVSRVEGLLATLQPRGCVLMEYPVSNTIPRVKRAPEAVLTAKNLIRRGPGYVLQVLRFYPELKDGMTSVCKGMIRETLGYDYAIFLNQVAREAWTSHTRGMNFFTRRRSDPDVQT